MLTPYNAKSVAVLSILIDLCGEDALTDLIIQPSINGRESGFHVQTRRAGIAVTFANMRGTDGIVIYYGSTSDFNPQGLGPTEDTYYERRKSFDYNEYLQAAQWVKSYLVDSMKSLFGERHEA